MDIARYALLYAGAQKNAGPAGVTIAIVRDDLLAPHPRRAAGRPGLPDVRGAPLDVQHAARVRDLRAHAGDPLAQRRGREAWRSSSSATARRHRSLYDAIDGSDGFYRGHAEPGRARSMNVTWRLPSEDLERRFLEEAAAERLVELKGHRSVGGIRASLYNAMPLAGAQALAEFMRTFAASHHPAA